MRIHRFSSTQFRNLEHDAIVFSPGVNLFIGDNGQGKTNLLEAVCFFKFGRSFRTSRDTELIRFEAPFCRVEATAEHADGGKSEFAASIARDGTKRVTLDGKEVPRYSELVGRYPCVLFGPHDLALVSGGPSERRRFLDMTSSMCDRDYLESLRNYRRVLTHRNAVLKAGSPGTARAVWDEELVNRGCELVAKRERVIDDLRRHMQPFAEAIRVPYAIDMSYESELTGNRPADVTREAHFAAQLAAVEAEESRRRTTLVGPHRDDVRIRAGGKDVRRYGSQGQRRLVAVLLRLTELAYLEERLGEPCVLLLDDLFSEFDTEVSEKLKERLDGGHQIFVTSPVPLRWKSAVSSSTFFVSGGKVRE